ncbi:hypothetical protein BDP27DRAFT_1231669 [Rhodocollybia butyracea]|uniref:NAD(P)-binding protein n=1 Tax=Rhodocollybia butyracea TaxID=206335 RepID=A0A9P5PED4_9AGAR|nr:hypothetical protein BDP27DRAFT_1231669 [Rhodocollybia butyracea]
MSSQVPIAVFVGGTSGIGRSMAEAFAQRTDGNAHIVIIGRNKAAADQMIASFPESQNTDAIHEFLSTDVSLVSNVHRTASALLERLPRIDCLVLSSGILVFAGRKETSEGLDEKMVLSYYSRWTFIHDLLPLLRNSERGAKVYTILGAGAFGAGANAPIERDNLDLKKSHTLGKMLASFTTYTNVAFQKLAKEEPTIAFNHAYPGIVRSPMFTSSKCYWKVPYYVVYPVFSLMSKTPEEAGDIHLDALMKSSPGFNSYDPKGQLMSYAPADEETVDIVWKHTLEITERLR